LIVYVFLLPSAEILKTFHASKDAIVRVLKVERFLTILVVAAAVAALTLVYFEQMEGIQQSYNSEIGFSVSKEQGSFDYSCDQPFYGLYLKVSNEGSKVVSDFSISITNPLCKGAVPPLPSELLPSHSIAIYLYSTEQNGTVTISGNNTMIFLKF
jgi:hypothetical protein